jgi:prevent-host-death family protein
VGSTTSAGSRGPAGTARSPADNSRYMAVDRASRATIAHMSTVASRDLRNHTADVLRQVAGGTHVTVTVNGTPVAEISPARSTRPQFLSKAEFAELVLHQADSGLTDDLEKLAGETTADLDPL